MSDPISADDPTSDTIEFYLDHSLIDLSRIKRIGFEKSICAIIVEVDNEIILQTVNLTSFSDHTIKPLKKQIVEILPEPAEKQRNKIVNSIVTCISRNIEIISKYCKQSPEIQSINNEESNKVDELIKMVLESENTEELFKDKYGKPFAAVRIGKERHIEILPMASLKFKRYLTKLYRENNRSSISDGSLNTVITNLAAEAEYNEVVIPLHLRVAWGSDANRSCDDCIYYDVSDKLGSVIQISKNGWQIIKGSDSNVPILFRRYNQQPLTEPDRNYSLNIFDQLLNLTNVKNPKHRHLIKVYIISTLIPEIDHVILTTYGPKGAAKSFLLELIKKLVDPSSPILLTLHRNIDQFIQQVNHNYINYYDNVKFIPYWLSDEICKAVTGIGHTKRQLFTDDEDIIYEHKRCMGLNGINVALIESDALDRSLFIELEEIDEENRKKEEDLWKEFDRIKSQVLGYILDILVKALRIKSTLKLEKLPRMADWTNWCEAISQALDYPPMSFLQAYRENRNEQNMIAVNENPIGSLLLKYVNNHEKQFGSIIRIDFEPQELHKALVDFAENSDVSITDRQFPKNAASMVKKLKTIMPNLKAAYSIIIEIGRNTSTNTSLISIYRKKSNTDIKDIISFGGSEQPQAIDSISLKRENKENSISTITDKTDDSYSANGEPDKRTEDIDEH